MTLFNDIDLFMAGTTGKTEFDLPDADVMLIDNFFNKEESDYYYQTLLEQTTWREYEMPMYDKVVTAPRMISWHQDDDVSTFGYSASPLSDDLNSVRQRVEMETRLKFNAVLLNLYRS